MNPTTHEEACLPDEILDQQRARWLKGEAPSIESLLAGTPFANDREAQLDLIYHEIVLREELQQPVGLQQYSERFPHLQADLELHFQIHQALLDADLVDTNEAFSDESWPESRSLPETTPDSIGEYEIERELGRGGMAIVYLARHKTLKRSVALKTFRTGRGLSSREISRIRTEAEAIARLSHRNIIQIYEIGEQDGFPWIALEYAEQGTLSQKLQSATLAPDAAAVLIETLARALEHAHSRQIVHRDLKPANVLFSSSGEPKIGDFGLAKVLYEREESSVDVTRTGEAVGTPRYMAPEQASGAVALIGPRTDVYTLGTLLYECLTGRPPFVSTSVVDTLRMITDTDPLPPRKLERSLPRDLETICLHCLEKSPERRYASAEELANDLHRFRSREPIAARPTPIWERLWKWGRRHPALATLLLIGVLLLTSGVSAAVVHNRWENQRILELRGQIAELVQDGRTAIENDELEAAQAKFQEAWQFVQSEPQLFDHETSVAGWLDHARNAINKYHWKQRVPPREFDELRDSAILESALVVPHLAKPIPLVREAIRHVLELTPQDATWSAERDRLRLIDASMVALASGPEPALSELEKATLPESRAWYDLRADLLQQLGRNEESQSELKRSEGLPPRPVEAAFQQGLNSLRQAKYADADRLFQKVLDEEPEHFLARLLQGVCCLQLQELGEARIALTAAVAQRPTFHWSYLFRSRVYRALGDLVAARNDLEQALACQPPKPESYAALVDLGIVCRDAGQTDRARELLEQAAELLPTEPAAVKEIELLNGGAK